MKGTAEDVDSSALAPGTNISVCVCGGGGGGGLQMTGA